MVKKIGKIIIVFCVVGLFCFGMMACDKDKKNKGGRHQSIEDTCF